MNPLAADGGQAAPDRVLTHPNGRPAAEKPRLHLALTRSYWPLRESVDIAVLAFEYGYVGYRDARVDMEYERYTYRDICAGMQACLCGQAVLWTFALHIPAMPWIAVHLTFEVLCFTVGFLDLGLHFFGPPTATLARWRHALAVAASFVAVSRCGLGQIALYPTCKDAVDLLGFVGLPAVDRSPASIARHCRDVFNGWSAISWTMFILMGRLRFHELAVMSVYAALAFYSGYLTPIPAESDQPARVKGAVAVFGRRCRWESQSRSGSSSRKCGGGRSSKP